MSIVTLFLYLTFLNWSIISFLWFFCKKQETLDYLKIYWAIGIVFMAWSAMLIESVFENPDLNFRQILTNILITVWGIRLSSHLYNNKFYLGHDFSHKRLKTKEEFSLKTYVSFFLLLGLVQITIISPAIYINFLPGYKGFNLLDCLGLMVFVLGWVIETKSDRALIDFKKLKQNKLKVLKTNLWSYSRHPNYFGTLLQWWGLYLIACNAIGGFWSFYGPLLMTSIFLLRSIKRQEDKLLTTLPDYYLYTQETNKLIPNLSQVYELLTGYLILFSPKKSTTYVFGYLSHSKNIVIRNVLFFIFNLLYKPDLKEFERISIRSYSSFNDFFTRKLKSEARNIDLSEFNVISPVDGTISSHGRIKKGELIQAKGLNYSLEDLIKNKTQEEFFKDGHFITIYLAPKNYHRIHFPLAGTIKETKYFKGNLYSVNAISKKIIPSLYTKNERTLIHVKSKELSYSLVSIGAFIVGSIIPFWLNDETYIKDKIVSLWNDGPSKNELEVKKGQELGFFEMGSTVILLFPKSIQVEKNFLSENKAVKFGEVLFNLKIN